MLNITSSTAQGLRGYQEDRFVIHQNDIDGLFIAVFDGHGSDEVSHFASAIIYDQWLAIGGHPTDRLNLLVQQLAEEFAQEYAGSTLSIAYIPPAQNKIYCAILGDSPIIIYDPADRWTNISPEHNVAIHQEDKEELMNKHAPISKGYYFSPSGNGLQLTRSLGDVEFTGLIKTTPDIYQTEIMPGMWMLVSTDGLYQTHRPQAKQPIINMIAAGCDAQQLVDFALLTPTHDNATAVLVRF